MKIKEIIKSGIFSDGDWVESKDQDPSGSIRLIQLADIGNGSFIDKSERFMNEETAKRLKCTFLKKNDILIARMPDPIGRCCLFPFSEENKYVTVVDVCILRPKENVDNSYLKYAINSPFVRHEISRQVTGTTRQRITKKKIGELDIPLPPLPTQKKIAAILDAADAYRQQTKALIEKYDQLAQSLFLDMFGDPVVNPMDWDKEMGSTFYEVRGRVGWKGYKKTDLRDSGPLVLGATHINKSGYIDLAKPVFITEEKFLESPEIMINRNDLIFVQRGNTIGKVGIVSKPIGKATINPVVLILRPKDTAPLFILHLLLNEHLKQKIIELNSGSAQPMITQKSMNEYEFINPPINLQNQFADRIQLIEQQKQQAQASLQKAEDLFNSLLQRAFSGELVK